jgi:putative glutamine amidotransferase
VTDTGGREDKFKAYTGWLESAAPGVRCLKLEKSLEDLSRCHGLVLTGGGDVDPVLYGGAPDHPKLSGVDRRRDDFERKLLDRALSRGIPVLGICRGLQLANVHFGGALIPDLEEAGYGSHRGEKGSGCTHAVRVSPGTCMERAAGRRTGLVHSSHHQAAAAPGKGLLVSARSEDGVIEAMELEDNPAGAYFLLVQWHPERMQGGANPFESGVLKSFIETLQQQQS